MGKGRLARLARPKVTSTRRVTMEDMRELPRGQEVDEDETERITLNLRLVNV